MTKKSTSLSQAIDDLVARCDPSARGIVQCLRMLADEAALLSLPGTRRALKRAMATCAAESHELGEPLHDEAARVPPGTPIH
jgi:hypothetical protein